MKDEGPWTFRPRIDHPEFEEFEIRVPNVGVVGYVKSPEDARRIVACVNACVRWETNALEDDPEIFNRMRASSDEGL